MNALDPALSSSEVLLTSNYTHSINYSVSSLSLSSYLIKLDFSENPASHIELSLLVHAFDVSQVKVSEIPKAVLLNFTAKADDTSLTDQTSQEMASSIAAYSTGAVIASSALSGSASVLLCLLNTVQYISFIPLANVVIEPQLRGIFLGSNPVEFIPNVPLMLVDPDDFDKPYTQANEFGYETSVFLFNAGKNLMLLCGLMLLHLGSALGTLLPCDALSSFSKKTLKSYHFNAYLVYLIGVYMELHAAACIQLASSIETSPFVIFNCVFAGLFIALLSVLPFVVSYLASLSADRSVLLFEVLFAELKGVKVTRHFYVVFFLHRYLSLSAIIFIDNPAVSLSLCTVFTGLVRAMQKVVYLSMVRPFNDTLLYATHFTADSCSFVCVVVVLVEFCTDTAYVWMRVLVILMLLIVVGSSVALSLKNAVVSLRSRKSTVTLA
jgi:hypothetical protein